MDGAAGELVFQVAAKSDHLKRQASTSPLAAPAECIWNSDDMLDEFREYLSEGDEQEAIDALARATLAAWFETSVDDVRSAPTVAVPRRGMLTSAPLHHHAIETSRS